MVRLQDHVFTNRYAIGVFDGVGTSTRPDLISFALARECNLRTSKVASPASTENNSLATLIEVASSDAMKNEGHAALSWAMATQLSNGHQQRQDAVTASTACLVRVASFGTEDNRQYAIHAANVGDGFWIVLRQGAGNLWSELAHSEPSFHDRTRSGARPPLQIAYDLRGTWVMRGDVSNRAHRSEVPVQSGDIVLAMSAGAVDNLPIAVDQPHRSLAAWIVSRINRDVRSIRWTPEKLVSIFKQRVQSSMRSAYAKHDDYSIVAARVSIGLPAPSPTLAAGTNVYPVQQEM